ncbi:MAG TPA: DUF2141 domain-containing protein [Bacteroidales bacterium]|nr:DUF2141 domain-containing protein [Bacteroidales bacterium]HPS16588.1 DUF2141 domain-containing protein [Bacteroidales bacterium]
MKTFVKSAALIIIVIVISAFSISFDSKKISPSTQNINLTVKLTGLDKIKGKAHIALWNSANGYPEKEKVYKGISMLVTSTTLKYTFNIPPGTYAIGTFHDADSNEELSTNFFGIPTEGFGFSNNYRPVFSKPSFEDVKINVQKNTEIEMIYIF